MLLQMVICPERSLAELAGEGLLPGVGPHVANHDAAVHREVPTLSADEASHLRAMEHVPYPDVDLASSPRYQGLQDERKKKNA
jgi:hypothetical protein